MNAKRNYFKDKLESEKTLNHYGSLSRTWVCRLRRAKPLQVILVSKLIANFLLINKRLPKNSIHFILQLPKLVEKLPQSFNKFRKNFVEGFYRKKGVFPNGYSFSVVSENKVLKYLNSLGINKATGLDDKPSRFVKYDATIVACPLTHVINFSLIRGVVPDNLKSVRVVPLYKNSDKTDVGNYRPVSILTIISKVFERVVYDQVES